ncbi:MAG: signal peptidase I [Nanoarchaeota archaeon]|nr:signal peptidase I [Nanoarchaeota archaeon]
MKLLNVNEKGLEKPKVFPRKFIFLIGIIIFAFFVTSFIYLTPNRIPIGFFNTELSSPSNWLNDEEIKVFENMVVIKHEGVILSSFADTNSMDPLIDENTHGLEIKPKENQLKVGDIISYKSDILGGTIIHRIIEINQDEKGTFYTTQGDNNNIQDPEKIRFEQIEGVLIGILY